MLLNLEKCFRSKHKHLSDRDAGIELGDIGARVDAADVLATGHTNITVVTPSGTPAVLDLPVVSASIGAISDQQNSMVCVSSTVASDHTTRVVLKDVLVGFDCNGHWLLLCGSHQVLVTGRANETRDALDTFDGSRRHGHVT